MVQGVIVFCAVLSGLSGVSVEATVQIETADGIETRDAWSELDRDAAAIETTGESVS